MVIVRKKRSTVKSSTSKFSIPKSMVSSILNFAIIREFMSSVTKSLDRPRLQNCTNLVLQRNGLESMVSSTIVVL